MTSAQVGVVILHVYRGLWVSLSNPPHWLQAFWATQRTQFARAWRQEFDRPIVWSGNGSYAYKLRLIDKQATQYPGNHRIEGRSPVFLLLFYPYSLHLADHFGIDILSTLVEYTTRADPAPSTYGKAIEYSHTGIRIRRYSS